MRRLLVLVSVLVCVDTMLYAALTPLLPHFANELGLSKGQAGVLVAAYAAGALVGGLPGGFATVKLGAQRAVLVGLTLMALASIGFAFANEFWSLFGARFLQGCGSGFTWAGAMSWLLAATPRERRGEYIGTAMGAAVFGALFGPVLGAGAAIVGRVPVFVALSGLSVVLGAWALRIDDAPAEEPSLPAMRAALRHRTFLQGIGFMALPALLFGILALLGPLHLAAATWGAAAIGAVWLVSAALETAVSPVVGRIVDRRGNLFPVRISLVAGTVVSALLAFGGRPLVYVPLVALASIAYGMLFTPAFTLLADGAEAVGLAQGMAFGLMNAAWATGALLGPAAAGVIADATGDAIPFLIAAVLCAGAFVLVRPRSARGTARVRTAKL
jgi:MFS family permease